ncbi:hypothetical protein JQN58_35470 [Aneurinibacillus sp. BA2021]|nr:hypothetical protein [Aneurinibacillus sp. BA2021]
MSTDTITAPRTRWAAIIWGVVLAAIAGAALWVLADDDRRAALADGVATLTPATILTVVLLSAGALLLVGGAAGLVRRVQRRRTEGVAAFAPDAAEAPVAHTAE